MKAFFSFLFVLSILSATIVLLSRFNAIENYSDKTISSLLLLEERHARELELKRAIVNTIIYSAREAPSVATADEITATIAEDLAKLEELETSYYNIKKLAVSFWCGSPTQQDLREAITAMHWSGKTALCRNCQKLSAWAVRIENNNKRTVRYCAKYLSVDTMQKVVTVSSADTRVIGPGIADVEPGSGQSMFGASVYDTTNDIASVIMLPMSSRISWSDDSI